MVMSECSVIPWPWVPTKRLRRMSDEFFDEGNFVCSQQYKYSCLSNKELEEEEISEQSQISCHLPGCCKVFASLSNYELHYNASHRNVCHDCRRTFPSAHLLEIHVLEWHDVLFELLAAKKNMYQCLVETCSERFSDEKSRKDHLVVQHKYPASFRFHKQQSASRHSCLNKRCSGKTARMTSKQQNEVVSESMDTSENISDSAVEDTHMFHKTGVGENQTDDSCKRCTDSSKKTFVYQVPNTVTFGQGVQRSFQRNRPQGKKGSSRGRHWHQLNKDSFNDTSVNIEEVNMTDLSDALQAT